MQTYGSFATYMYDKWIQADTKHRRLLDLNFWGRIAPSHAPLEDCLEGKEPEPERIVLF